MPNDETTFAALGMAALLPGMQHMVTLMQEQTDQLRAELAAAMNINEHPETPLVAPRRGRPPGVKEAEPRRSGWPDDPEERKAEMARRKAVGASKKATHPRDPRHPGHDAWLKKLRAAQKKRWDGLTPAQQKAQLRKMTKASAASRAGTARNAVEELKAAS